MEYTLGDIIESDCYYCDTGSEAKVIAIGPNYVNYQCTTCGKVDSSVWTVVIDDMHP